MKIFLCDPFYCIVGLHFNKKLPNIIHNMNFFLSPLEILFIYTINIYNKENTFLHNFFFCPWASQYE